MKTNQETLDFGIGNKQYKAIKDWSGGFSSVWVGSSVPCPGARQPSGELQEGVSSHSCTGTQQTWGLRFVISV